MIDGLLLVDKPADISSFGVVSKVRWLITQEVKRMHTERGYCHELTQPITVCKCKTKVGHTGTLDPAATGLLVLAIGKYTKRVPELIKQDKTYEVTMCLGKTSTTGDKEGKITAVSDTQPTREQITEALVDFTGDLIQTPPAFSAIKIDGQRAYDLARKGKEVVIEPRPVKIYSNILKTYEYPLVTFDCEVGSGTYIRSLVEDIGAKLGTGAYMSDLRRTKIGAFDVTDAIQLDGLEYPKITQHLQTLVN
jgi:tRNA pseudouridine55 synthase